MCKGKREKGEEEAGYAAKRRDRENREADIEVKGWRKGGRESKGVQEKHT